MSKTVAEAIYKCRNCTKDFLVSVRQHELPMSHPQYNENWMKTHMIGFHVCETNEPKPPTGVGDLQGLWPV